VSGRDHQRAVAQNNFFCATHSISRLRITLHAALYASATHRLLRIFVFFFAISAASRRGVGTVGGMLARRATINHPRTRLFCLCTCTSLPLTYFFSPLSSRCMTVFFFSWSLSSDDDALFCKAASWMKPATTTMIRRVRKASGKESAWHQQTAPAIDNGGIA
jgi:hypothetical protein